MDLCECHRPRSCICLKASVSSCGHARCYLAQASSSGVGFAFHALAQLMKSGIECQANQGADGEGEFSS